MTSRRTAAVAGTVLVLAGFSGAPAFAHGSMTDPVSRVAACYAEGPESPDSAACRAAVAASGPQAFYDWNAVNIADAAGRHRELIPDGKLCSAGNDKYRGLDLARADWPASPLAPGKHTFRYKGTAPHKGTFALYVTKDGYDPSAPLTWSDLEERPFLTVTDPGMSGGDYVFEGTVPEKSGRHLIYSIWQRSDSPEAFYTCSDVVFGGEGGTGGGAAPSASAPTDTQVEEGAEESSVEHGGHGDHDASTGAGATAAAPEPTAETAPSAEPATAAAEPAAATPSVTASAAPVPAPAPAGGSVELAETGGSSVTPHLALGGAGVLAAGAAVLFRVTRRRTR
ncbi:MULTISPECIES: lytic polysaccharide monooxygenase auxiliary activity family 9 protein [Streptomyces]|uniref:Lytic polysaccharide monooxygenase n=2 Tax=Streptomyces TaxID=1883 RepID=A0ABU4KBF3_9ACTN|nr:lytic polysaccharide monooxygenase [Streptomyces roseolus]MDX2294655.1 lytic polysaccharide monooxygenase [Streptomyces roseolus]